MGHGYILSLFQGHSAREVAELRRENESGDDILTNQCLFIRTINHLLPDRVWERLKATKFGTIKGEESDEDDEEDEEEEEEQLEALRRRPFAMWS